MGVPVAAVSNSNGKQFSNLILGMNDCPPEWSKEGFYPVRIAWLRTGASQMLPYRKA